MTERRQYGFGVKPVPEKNRINPPTTEISIVTTATSCRKLGAVFVMQISSILVKMYAAIITPIVGITFSPLDIRHTCRNSGKLHQAERFGNISGFKM